MTARRGTVELARARGQALTDRVLHELRHGRLDRDLSEAAVGAALGISGSQYSRIERGLTSGLSIERAAILLAAVGLELSVRAFPSGRPIRDAGHAGLIARFRRKVAGSIAFRTEVPLPIPGDLRAWDVLLAGAGSRHGYEAETRPTDRQALERRLELKARDGEVDGVSLLLIDSRHNREFVRANREALVARFPVPGPRALEALEAGSDPGRGSVILL
jgi:transcriptional regulator with XRE-family HTH domain